MDEKVFNRIEKKYLITKKDKSSMLRVIKKNLQKDNYFKSEIYNIYFDTDNYDLIIQSIDRPIFKEKLRARSYGGYDKVFLEIKTKILGSAYKQHFLQQDGLLHDENLGYKRRVLITRDDFRSLVTKELSTETLAAKSIERASDLQIAREVDYLIEHFHLAPKILVYYDRESYVDEKNLRITFDTNIHFRHTNLDFAKKPEDRTLLKPDHDIIMEIKAHDAMPLWLVRQLSTRHLYPVRFSKIGKAYELMQKEKNV